MRIVSCTLSNCAATTYADRHARSGANFGGLLRCDPTNREIVWTSTSDGSIFTINRASPTGANARTVTLFSFLNDGANWQLLDSGTLSRTDFYTRIDSIMHNKWHLLSASLYYIATNIVKQRCSVQPGSE